MPTVVLAGGGSGGHITPILAVATELKRLAPEIKTVYIGQKGDGLVKLTQNHPSIDEVHVINAGKFRRYHGEGFRQLLHAPTVSKNLRDAFKVAAGAGQAYRLLGRLKADIIYTPGGYVGVPVGLAGARRKIPHLTHDLDAVPGLANRINARWAALHITALPAESYMYPPERVLYVGVPVSDKFVPVDTKLQQSYRDELGLPTDSKVLFVIGGGLGAQRINQAVLDGASALLTRYKDLYILHATGANNQNEVRAGYESRLEPEQLSRVRPLGFIEDVYKYSGAADVVVTRAGATNMAEFENQHKACVVIPSPVFSGGHQVKNVERWKAAGAVEVVTEEEMTKNNALISTVRDLLDDPKKRSQIGEKLGSFAHPKAAHDVAKTIINMLQK
jgi:UDP-N-acetylglucosamine--N-acetylmuramyl-(pentapeptide) pyrophosphoryl-undecaprenol N-acetylglucosamine transferase